MPARLRRSRAAWASACLVALGCGHRPAAPPSAPARGPVVTIVVDQMAAWLAARRWPLLPADGGFRRLLREGTYYPEMLYAHAVTDTAPGHAALYTARVPRDTGIFANELIAPGGAAQSILADTATRLVAADGATTDRPGSSLARLRGDTLADVLRAQVPGAFIFSVSLKDRGALFGGGRAPTATLWLDPALAEMVTSTAFSAPPVWAAAEGGRAALARDGAAAWTLTAAERAFVTAHAETPDAQPGEGDAAGLGISFPHAVGSPKAMRATPFGDGLVLSLAAAAVRALAADPRPALIAVSLSSHDYVLHLFGPHSWEAWAELARLDGALADFLRTLDGAFGPDGYAVILSADHGSAALPELGPAAVDPWCARPADVARWQLPCHGPRRRLLQRELVAALERALSDVLGPGPWVEGLAEPFVFLSPRARALGAAARARVVTTARAALAPFGLADVVDVRALPARCAATGASVADLVCRSVAPDAPPDLYLVVSPGVFFDPGYAVGFGTSHGSPYLYDRAVPLVVRAPGRFAAGVVHDEPVTFTLFAKTAASLLGVRLPD